MPLRFYNPTPRSLRWYINEYKKLQATPPEVINWNANKFVWFTTFALEVRYHRIKNNRWPNTGNSNAIIGPELIKLFEKVLGPLVLCSCREFNKTILLPRNLTSAYRLIDRSLIWVTKPYFTELQRSGNIRWCSYSKDWWHSSAFFSFITLDKNNEPIRQEAAGTPVFECSICNQYYEDLVSIKRKHPLLRTHCCKWCVNTPVQNKPHTLSTVYGGYHTHKRSWKFFPIEYPKDPTVPIGVELEMQWKHELSSFVPHHAAMQLYLKQQEINKDWNYFYTESDSSIGDAGIEMITQPMTRRMHNVYWKAMLPIIRENFIGWNTEDKAGERQYGIHLTFEIERYGQFNLMRLIKFIENKKNQCFSQALAQRGQLYNAIGKFAEYDKKVRDVVLFKGSKMMESTSRAQAIHVKTGGRLCEVRMFRSTLNRTSFMKNLQFLYAFHDWSSHTPFNTSHEAFIEWLLKNEKLYLKYSCLYKYLAYKVFPVKHAWWSTSNPWSQDFSAVVLRNQKGQTDMFQETYTPSTVDYQS